MPSFQHIENCLRLVDSFVLGQWNTDAQMDGKLAANNVLELSRTNGLADDLVAMCVAVELLADGGKSDKSVGKFDSSGDEKTIDRHATAHKCMESALRTLLSLTRDDEGWCRSFVASKMTLPLLMRVMIQSHKHRSRTSHANSVIGMEDESFLDRICLALGVLTNLTQMLSTVKGLLRKTCEAFIIEPL